MKLTNPLLALLAAVSLSVPLIGCGGGSATPATDEEKSRLNSQMDDDMKKMQGQVPKKPGAKKN